MSYRIDEIEGIGPANAKKLGMAGIRSTGDLLKKCCDKNGRRQVASTTGVDESRLLRWANMADLMRVKGIGRQYAELLEASGVDTVKELRMRRPENLAASMAEVNRAKKLTRATPAVKLVRDWVDAAKAMKPLISH